MANKYYQKHKERLRKEARERYQNLSEEGKTKYEKEMLKFYRRRKKRRHYYQEHEQKLPGSRRNYYLTYNK